MKTYIIMPVLCCLLVACNSNRVSNESADVNYQGDTVVVSESSVVNSKIKLHTVSISDYNTEFTTTGVVKAVNGRLAGIATPFDGRITKSFVKLGQRVNAGTPIVELHSAEYSAAVRDYYQSVQAKKQAASNLDRQKALVEKGVGSVREMEQAETDYEYSFREFESALATLKMLGIDTGNIGSEQAMRLTSPIAGEVVKIDMVIGQFVKSDADPLAIVADLDEVWVIAQIKEKHINSIGYDDKVEVRTDADRDNPIIGRISHISELMDEDTRSVEVMVSCENKDRKLRPGMFASVHFIGTARPSIVIPSTAILQDGDNSYVFVHNGDGRFVKRNVTTTMAGLAESLVTSGLVAGESIVAEGGIYLMGN